MSAAVALARTPERVAFADGCGAVAHVELVTSGTKFAALPTAYHDVRGDRIALCSCGARLVYRGDLEDHKPYRADADPLDEDGDERREDSAAMNYDGSGDPDCQRSYL